MECCRRAGKMCSIMCLRWVDEALDKSRKEDALASTNFARASSFLNFLNSSNNRIGADRSLQAGTLRSLYRCERLLSTAEVSATDGVAEMLSEVWTRLPL